LVTRRYDFPDLLELTVEEIAHYGTHDLQTPRRLRAMLNDLTTIARPEYAADIDRWLNAISPR
jgi:uncharacterized membrane protein